MRHPGDRNALKNALTDRPPATTSVHASTTRGFLFADLREYTSFVEKHGDDAAAALLSRYRNLVREVVARFDAAEIRTEGDAFYVVFSSASSAVQGGLAILAAAAEANQRDPARPIRAAVGVHAGETAETGEGPIGSAVNIAARVCSQARAGELLVTDTVRSLTRTRLPVRFSSRGSPRLKGITEPITLFAVEAAAADAAEQPRPTRAHRRSILGAIVVIVLLAGIGGLVVLRPSTPPGSLESTTPTRPAASVEAGSLAASTPRGSPTVASLACWGSASGLTLPVVQDVAYYRATADRTSVYPGPGPICAPKIAWQRTLGIEADFTPIVVDGRIIVGDRTGVHAFEARTGEPLWTVQSTQDPLKPSGFRQSAVAADHLIFAADLGGTLHAIDVATGSDRWTRPLPNDGTSPTVANGLVWVGSSDGHAYALDPTTGDQRWNWDGPANSVVHVDLVTPDVAYIDVGPDLYAVRLVDRGQLWRFTSAGRALTSAVLSGDTIFVGIIPGDGSPIPGALHALDRTTGHDRWRPFVIAGGGQITPGPVRDGILYVTANGDGVYALRDAGTEARVVWHDPDLVFSGRPASLAGDVLYVQQQADRLVALRAADGVRLWDTGEGLNGGEAPVVTGGFVYQVDEEADFLRAWAEPALTALLPSRTPGSSSSGPPPSTSPSPSPTPPRNPLSIVKSLPLEGIGVSIPVAMDVGPDGHLYLLHDNTDKSRPRLTVVDPKTGKTLRSWGRYGSGPGEFDLSGNEGNPATGCIAIAPNGDVYVGEYGNRRVQVFRPDGRFVRGISGSDAPNGDIGSPGTCKIGADGSLFVGSEDTLKKVTADGRILWRVPGVYGVAVRKDGMILAFPDSPGAALILDPGDGHIDRWGVGGRQPGEIGASPEPSLDRSGNAYVFQHVPTALQVFDPKGRFLGGMYRVPGHPNVGPGRLSNEVFWPPPVFTSDGFGYTFGADGLVRLKVTLGSGSGGP